MTATTFNESTSSALHQTPPTQRIIAEQFRAVGMALRPEAYFFIGALLLFGILLLVSAAVEVSRHTGYHQRVFVFGTAGAIPLFCLALFVPFGVWRTEDPSRRSYHWSMPIARGPHTIMKFMSGWAWLMIASMAYLAFLVLLATILSIITGEANRVASGPLWEWAVAFTAPTLGYLMISAAVVGSDHAWRWIIGVVLGFWILITVFAVFQLPAFAIFLKSIWSGTYGLKTALFGGAVDPVSGLLLSNATSRWLVAMPLWIVGAAAATTILSYRHSE